MFAFSTENWNRPDDEVRGLLDLLAETIRREFPDMGRMGVRVRFVGRRDRCSPSILTLIEDTERDTAANEALTLWICFDYGGRAELVEAARRLVRDGIAAEDVDEAALVARLSAPDMPEPDLVIRTSGEQRLSNFLLWQTAYSEYVFTPTLWPDFGEEPLRAALAEYAGRRRRFGADERPPRPRARRSAARAGGARRACTWAGSPCWCSRWSRARSRWTSSSAWRADSARSR